MDDQPKIFSASDEQPVAINAAAAATKPLLIGPKRQHFLPQFYLEGFTKDGVVAVFDRELNEVRVQQPINTGVIGHFYTLEDSEGRKRFELEALLSEYEGKASPVIRALVAKGEITAEQRIDLAIFVALAAFRTPDIIDSIKGFHSSFIGDMVKQSFADPEVVKTRMRGKPYAPSSEEELEKEAHEMVEYAQSDKYQVKTDHKWAVGMAMRMAFNVAPIFAGRNWGVIHRNNENKSFVTTDAPVVLTTVTPRERNFLGIGFGNADAMVLFPLTESSVLVIYGSDGNFRHWEVSAERIRSLNLVLADRCQRFVIGREEALVRSLANHLGLASKKWEPKMQRT